VEKLELQHSAPFSSGAAAGFLATVPAAPAVFALWPRRDPERGMQPYLGRSRNLRHRLERLLAKPRPGLRRLNLHDFTDRVDYQPVGSTFEASWLIYRLNREHYPRTYRQRLRLKPPALLKVNLSNRFPRCYSTTRLTRDGSLYYGPFPSRAEAERYAGEFLDFFKIRRCVEDLDPNPAHPGCIYSQMKMCLAPCFAGCSDDEYQHELGRSVAFLDSEGTSLVQELEHERTRSADLLDFEQAGRLHQRLEKVNDLRRRRPDLARKVTDLHAVMLQRGADPASVVFFRVWCGELRGPMALSLDQNVASPVPLDQQIQELLASLAPVPQVPSSAESLRLPHWENLAILARWYYSSFREGEFLLLKRPDDFPHAKLIRLCRKLTAA
jgi:excinuclease ABC subunit C